MQRLSDNYSVYFTRFNNLKLDNEAGDTAPQTAVMQKQSNSKVTSTAAVPSKFSHMHGMRKKRDTYH